MGKVFVDHMEIFAMYFAFFLFAGILFTLGLNATFPYLMPSMMVNRGVSFYLLMLISLAITIVRVVSYKRAKTKDCRMAA